MMLYHKTLGFRIRSLRNRLGISQAHFAAMLGTTEVTVNRWENNHAKPEGAAAQLLAILEQRTRAYQRAHSPDALGQVVAGAAIGVALIALLEALFGKGGK